MNANVADTLKPRAGKRFQPTKELALHEPALRACVDIASPRRDLTVVREMTGPYGIPDFTAIIGGRIDLDARLACPVPPLLNEIDSAGPFNWMASYHDLKKDSPSFEIGRPDGNPPRTIRETRRN